MVRILIYIFKNYQGEKAKTSLKAKEPSYANAKQLRRFAENSNSPPKYFPVATSTWQSWNSYLFSTILVRAAAVGFNNYKYGTDLSLCEIHHEKRGTHTTELARCYFPTGLQGAADLTHSRRKADIKARREHCFLFNTCCYFPSPVHEAAEIWAQYLLLSLEDWIERINTRGKRVPFCQAEEEVTAVGSFPSSTCPRPPTRLLCLLSTQVFCKSLRLWVWSSHSSLLLLQEYLLDQGRQVTQCAVQGNGGTCCSSSSFHGATAVHTQLTAIQSN